MGNMSKEVLEKLEDEYGLEPEELDYNERVKRVKLLQKEEKELAKEEAQPKKMSMAEAIRQHPLYGKKIIITPLMTPDAKRNLAFDEVVGHEIDVRDYNAGDAIYGATEDVQRMIGDYVVVREDKSKPVLAKTTFPKIGTEISYTLGKDLVPIVRGNDGSRGYLWSFPSTVIQVEDTLIQIFGLRTLIENIAPELLPEFRNKPMMKYIDGITLTASIPLADAKIKAWRKNELQYSRAGLV